ncbi:MAG: PE family protein, partial [Deltaproteobacteria bacterium]|nr:PE family protein [Deltaproteobacteria bacterium]
GGGGGYGLFGDEGIAAAGGPAGFNADGSGLNGASIDFSEGGFGGRGGIGGPGGEKSG